MPAWPNSGNVVDGGKTVIVCGDRNRGIEEMRVHSCLARITVGVLRRTALGAGGTLAGAYVPCSICPGSHALVLSTRHETGPGPGSHRSDSAGASRRDTHRTHHI